MNMKKKVKKVKYVGDPIEYIGGVTKHYHEKTVHVSGYSRHKPKHHKTR